MYFVAGLLIALLAFRLWTMRFTFRGQRPDHYAYQHPPFDLRRHLNGRFTCDGVIFGMTGRVVSRFSADVTATWRGETGVMVEHFRYDSGAVQDREWRLTVLEDGQIRAEADDVQGQGTGRSSGNSVLLRYRIRLPQDVGGHVLSVIDWLYLLENGTIVNRSQFRKFGVKVAELVATFRRRPA